MANIEHHNVVVCSICGKKDEGVRVRSHIPNLPIIVELEICEGCLSAALKMMSKDR